MGDNPYADNPFAVSSNNVSQHLGVLGPPPARAQRP
jgi:hypothetical protein